MKHVTSYTKHLFAAALMLLALTVTAGPASAGFFDFTQGRVAQPDTDLHALGTQALNTGLGGISYFTNGEGRIIEVRAKEMPNGDLRVSQRRVYIPKNYVAKTHDQTLKAERIRNSLAELADQQPWVGGYAVLPQSEGAKAYKYGVMVETELRRNHQSDN
ncbi:hypothetical protein [Desulfoluna spongiiphila]|uniref:Uncharacterized protein n=1 Tax=Desulfoluna spongiiphila TaxID=419481 RepID=A0A1G5I441_9BACT|nr:hypothetical protein [Desulfoluna spongiiphila]SCY70806.1 hypothetical protein SAMN05216233_11797 [Desulfoluna spongiiphila]VVS92716.1 hypothetical protein DBB_22840 [Desulfoluna spongiiphila]